MPSTCWGITLKDLFPLIAAVLAVGGAIGAAFLNNSLSRKRDEAARRKIACDWANALAAEAATYANVIARQIAVLSDARNLAPVTPRDLLNLCPPMPLLIKETKERAGMFTLELTADIIRFHIAMRYNEGIVKAFADAASSRGPDTTIDYLNIDLLQMDLERVKLRAEKLAKDLQQFVAINDKR